MTVNDAVDVQLVWLSDYWDGPVAGLAEWNGELLWFDAIWDESADDWSTPRRFRLRRLPTDELARQNAIHQDFENLVGTHCCLHHVTADPLPAINDDTRAAFYRLHPPAIRDDYDNIPALATFTTWTAKNAGPPR